MGLFDKNKDEEIAPDNSWFKKGAYEDGYQFGDFIKTVEASAKDLETSVLAGILGIGESAFDAFATISPYISQAQWNMNGGDFAPVSVRQNFNKSIEQSKSDIANFVSKDLYDEREIARAIVTARSPLAWGAPSIMDESNSVFGSKTDSLVQSGGQLLGTMALQAVGVPAWLTIGTTSFGGEAENAFKNGASYDQAALSSLITAGAEVLLEKLSGGISFGGKTFDDGLKTMLAANISSKTLQSILSFGIDAVGEGLEEVFSNVISSVGQKITYDKDKDISLGALFASEEAFENFIGGVVLGGVANVAGNKIANKDSTTGLDKDTEQKVVDKIFNDTVTEKEKSGEKLSATQKTKIYNQILDQLESGDISVSDIEDIIGEDFSKEIDKNLPEEEQKKQMNEKVFERVKDTKLVNSYVDEARRGESFQADINEYDEAERATIQSAIDAGFLNNTNKTRRFVNWVAKIAAKMNIKVDFTNIEKLKESGFAVNGKFVNGYKTKDGIGLNMQSKKLMETVVGHEITHVLEGTKELYDAMQETLFDYAKSKGELETRRKAIEDLYKGMKKVDIDSELTAELVGDYLFTDQEFINRLANDNRNLFQKIWDEVKYMWKQAHPSSPEAQKLEQLKRAFEEAYKQSKGVKGDSISQKSDLSSGLEKNSAENDISVLEGGSVTKFSLSTWTPETQKRVKNDLVKSGFDSEQVDKWIADTNSVAAVIAADKDRLDFEAADNQVMLKDNQEYIKTLDASTLCAKRLVYQGTFDAIQHKLPNTVLTSDDLIDLLNMMKEKGVQTPCGVCYVESRRRHLGKFAKEWLDGYKGEYKPNLDDVTTSDGLEALRKSHPQTYKDFVDAMNKKGSSNPKVVQLRTEYRNEIMSLTPAQIRKIEAIGGLRVQSFSDFETPHMLDMMQAVMDMSAKGLHSQAYTKVPNFAWVFGDTGIKINLSLIAEGDGFDADGNLAFSSTEGMSIDDAMALRDAYSSNVGTIIVGANDKHILACMADDRIDFIIPFHRSGWGKNELDMMGMSSYTDYTYGQKEHDLATGKGVANLYPPDYWDYSVSGKENAEKYLNLCAKLGREPKFSQFLVNNGDGSYSLQPDGSTDGYWKTLIDFKMYDNNGVGAAQQPVQPNFNMEEAYRVLNEYEGGANKLPVANEVVDEFVAKKQGVQFSVSEDTEATPRDVYFSRIDEVYDKLKGKAAGKSHSVDGYNFFLQKNDFDESAYISITTPKGEKLRHIVDGGNQWKNARLWHEAAKMVSNHENPNVATATTQEEAGEYSEIEGKREETKKTFKEKVSDTKTLGRKAVGYLVDKYQPFEELSLKTGNRELEAKANTMRTSERAAQHFIGKGADGVRAINDLRQEVEASGLENEFEEYMYDLLTTDRMSLEERAKPIIKKLGDKFKNMKLYQIKALAKKEITQKTTETSAQYIRDAREYLRAISARNKPVRGDFYTADIARAHATELEQKYPQFKQWAEDVYANTNFMLDKLVADGELSQEAADRFRELYPHFVPIRRVNREGKAIDVPLFSNRTGVDAPIKGATGGDGKIGYLFETLAMRAEQTFLAGAKNRLGIELKNTLKAKTTDAEVDVEDIFDEVDTHEERLKAGEDGKAPTFTVFENGKRVTFEIPEDIYEALAPTPEALKGTVPVLSAITKFQRGVLTEYNPFFMARNAVKDFQDVLINSQHAKETYKNFPEAMRQLYAYEHGGEEAQYAKEYFENGAEDLTYFDGKEKLFDSKNTENPWAKEKDSEAKRILGFIPSKISQASSFVERVPRLAEYIASRKAGASIDVAMLDAARVTTNFAAGGDVTKWANRNFATFLNASVQGAAQAVRNVREAKAQGMQGMLKLGAKVALAGIPYLILNALLWGDDDEYEELSDYIKENYYIVAKYGDGQFVRIPKGRMAAVIQSAFEQIGNFITGNDEVDFKRFGELMWENIAPNNPLENNVFAPIMNVAENKTWYGDDLVPQRLQDLPAGEQYDETTDLISKWLGETLNVSPYKLNYLLDQYSGVFGDMFLPTITPQAEGGNSSLLGGMIAPLTDQFTTDSTMKNQNVSDFYDTLDDLTASAKSKYATDTDVLRYRYMNTINSELSNLYKQKREVQNSNLPNDEKYQAVREIQRQIDLLAEQALNSYDSVRIYGNTATVGGITYKKNSKGEWQKVSSTNSSSSNKIWSDTTVDKFIQDFDLPKVNWD
jgi:DNA-binding ferritin-like protein (Dps family)